EIEIDKRRQDLAVFSEACSGLVDMIERGATQDELLAKVSLHVESLRLRIGRHPDRAILGCTHYELIADLFRQCLPDGTPLIHQPPSVAKALSEYIDRHPEFNIGHSALRRFLTTGPAGQHSDLIEALWGAPVPFESLIEGEAA